MDIAMAPRAAEDISATIKDRKPDQSTTLKDAGEPAKVLEEPVPWGPSELWWEQGAAKSDFFGEISKESADPDRGTAAMYNFASMDEPHARFENPRELFVTLKKKVDERCSDINSSSGCLIVLEDLGRNWVEMLGLVLKIPPYFFELHWASPLMHTLGMNRLPLGQDPLQSFVLGYTELYPGVTIPKHQGV
jgi:hypothetical protein